MKKIKLFLIAILLEFSCESCGLFGKKGPDPIPDSQGVSGKVMDLKTNTPLSGVDITLKDASITIRTDKTTSDGLYSLKSIPDKTYTIYAEKKGYVTVSKTVTIPKDQNSQLADFDLKPIYEIIPETGLNFGSDENVKTLQLKNNSDQQITFNIKAISKSFTIDPLSGPIAKNGNSFYIPITVNKAGLTPGQYKSTIDISFGDLGSESYLISFDVPNNEAPTVTSEKPSIVTKTTAQISGMVTNAGKGTITNVGHVVSETPEPKCCVPGFYTDLGAISVGRSFVSTLGPLVSGKTYYVRAYARNEKGINYSYNHEYIFTTSTLPTPPDISIVSITTTSPTSAKINAKINNNGGDPIKRYGVVWSKDNPTPHPEIEKTKKELNGEPTTAEIVINIDELTPNTQFYISAYAYNSSAPTAGVSSVQKFNTPQPIADAKMSTAAADDRDYTSATLKGSITDFGNVKIVEHGFVYSKSNADPRINGKNCAFKNLGNINMNSAIPFPVSGQVTGLFKGMNYYYRTYTKNENGDYSYSTVAKTFVTKEDSRIVHLTFNGNAEDVSGNGNNANSSAQSAIDRFNNPNSAYDLNKGIIQMINPGVGDFRGDMTTSVWVYLPESNFSGGRKILFGKDHDTWCDSDYKGYFIMIDPQKSSSLIFWYRQSGTKENSIPITTKEEIGDGKWHNLIITKSATILRFYLDGEEIRSPGKTDYDNISGRLYPISMGNMLRSDGCWWGSPISQINALIDDFRIYNTTFSPAQVLDLYNREK